MRQPSPVDPLQPLRVNDPPDSSFKDNAQLQQAINQNNTESLKITDPARKTPKNLDFKNPQNWLCCRSSPIICIQSIEKLTFICPELHQLLSGGKGPGFIPGFLLELQGGFTPDLALFKSAHPENSPPKSLCHINIILPHM